MNRDPDVCLWWVTCWFLYKLWRMSPLRVSPGSGKTSHSQTVDLFSVNSTNTRFFWGCALCCVFVSVSVCVFCLTHWNSCWKLFPPNGSLLLRPLWTLSRLTCSVWNQCGCAFSTPSTSSSYNDKKYCCIYWIHKLSNVKMKWTPVLFSHTFAWHSQKKSTVFRIWKWLLK